MTVNIAELDFRVVREHYLTRKRAHMTLRQLYDTEQDHELAQLALGISDRAGNYSAAEHGMGPFILAEATTCDILEFARAVDTCPNANHLPRVIYEQAIRGLKISIGSEIAMMLRPKRHWVGNIRTIWSHLVIKHRMDEQRANEELELYYDGEWESEMAYEIWRDVYLRMEPDMRTLGQLAADAAEAQGVRSGRLRYMWPDAVASLMFDQFASTRAQAQ